DDFAGDARIDQLSRLASNQGPTPPNNPQRFAIGAGFDLIRAIGGHDHATVGEFAERHERWIDLLDGIRKTRQTMRRRQVIGDAGFRSSRDRQREINWPLAHQPNAGWSISVTKENEARYVWPGDFRRKRCNLVACKS